MTLVNLNQPTEGYSLTQFKDFRAQACEVVRRVQVGMRDLASDDDGPWDKFHHTPGRVETETGEMSFAPGWSATCGPQVEDSRCQGVARYEEEPWGLGYRHKTGLFGRQDRDEYTLKENGLTYEVTIDNKTGTVTYFET